MTNPHPQFSAEERMKYMPWYALLAIAEGKRTDSQITPEMARAEYDKWKKASDEAYANIILDLWEGKP
jgi:predicted RecB family nuclease